ncbi:MAG: hypothetical protein RKP20_17935 [Candidatus Competibacter sp.]|nr:hypothetical protein [Candidatus Competibacter sp.]
MRFGRDCLVAKPLPLEPSSLLAHSLIGVFLGPTLVAITYTLLLAWLAEPPAD